MFGQFSTFGNQTRVLTGSLTINGLAGAQALNLVGAAGSYSSMALTDGHAGKQYFLTCGYAATGVFGVVDGTSGITRLQLNSNGTWTFTAPTIPAVPTVVVNGPTNNYTIIVQASTTSGQSFGPSILAGTTSADQALQINRADNGAVFFIIRGDGLITAPSTIPANNAASVLTCYSAFKAANTNRGATGIAQDPDLQVHINETGWYKFEAYVAFGGPTNGAGGITFNWGGFGGATFAALPNSSYNGSATVFGATAPLGVVIQAFGTTQTYATVTTTGGQGDFLILSGTINITATGVFSFNWAQNTSVAGGTTVFAGSRMMLQKIG